MEIKKIKNLEVKILENITDLNAVSVGCLIQMIYVYGAELDNLKCPPVLCICSINKGKFIEVIYPHPQNSDLIERIMSMKKNVDFMNGALCLYDKSVFGKDYDEKNPKYERLNQLIKNSGGWSAGIPLLP